MAMTDVIVSMKVEEEGKDEISVEGALAEGCGEKTLHEWRGE